MIQMNIDLEGCDLHRTRWKNRFDIARALIISGDDVNARGKDNQGSCCPVPKLRGSKPRLMTNTKVPNAILHSQK
jgi:hypothetical protein